MTAIYVPVLKSKMGELGALKELNASIRAQLYPVFDVTPVPWDHDNDAPAKTIDEHLAKLPDNLLKNIGALACAVDLTWIDPGDRMSSGAHPVSWLFSEFRARGVSAVPVVGPGYDPAYVAAAAAVVAVDKRGAVLRVVSQAKIFDPNLDAHLSALLSALGLTHADADLVIDLEAVPSGTELAIGVATAGALRNLASLAAWRSVVVAASSFPKDLSAYPQGTHVVDRSCWAVWNHIRMQPGLARLPTFGDYAIDHHDREEPDVSPKVMKASTNIRYTVTREWLVFKGPNWKDNTFAPMKGLCAQLVADPRFAGASFSWGDGYIDACSKGGPLGQATVWRKVATNHHLTFVVQQVASLISASTSTGRPLAGPGAVPPP